MRTIIIAGVIALLTGCQSNCTMLLACGGSRAANPVPVERPTDAAMTCPDIQAEITSNDAAILQKQEEFQKAQDQRMHNMAWGGTVAYDSSESGDAARKEENALMARNVHLRDTAHAKGC